MSIAMKCDRCGKLFEIVEDESVIKIEVGGSNFSDHGPGAFGFDWYKTYDKMDLCAECGQKLHDFLHDPELSGEKEEKTQKFNLDDVLNQFKQSVGRPPLDTTKGWQP